MKIIENIIYYGFIILFIYICLCVYQKYIGLEDTLLKCIPSSKDGRKYCVRERTEENMKKASNLLSNITNKCEMLITKMKNKYPNDEAVDRLYKGFNPKKIMETLPSSELTAYSENKGEKIAFCLNKTKYDENDFIDEDTLTFVALHEISHVMTKSVGHNMEFWKNFKFILINAKEFGIYNPIDYKKEPKNYCGMRIKDSPYYENI